MIEAPISQSPKERDSESGSADLLQAAPIQVIVAFHAPGFESPLNSLVILSHINAQTKPLGGSDQQIDCFLDDLRGQSFHRKLKRTANVAAGGGGVELGFVVDVLLGCGEVIFLYDD